MKIGSSIIMAVAACCALALTQGCVTTESQGSGRGAGARTKGPFKHQHKGKKASEEGTAVATEPYAPYNDDGSSVYNEEPIMSDSTYSSPEPNTGAGSYGETEIYIVQKGDMLSQLAVDYDTTTATLVEMNGLSNPDVLYVGQELSVPAGRGGPKTTTKPTGSIKKGGTYTIQKGDTLSDIALAAGVAIDDLRELNGIKGDMIMAGDELDIPSYGSVPSSARSSSKSNSSSSTEKKAEPTPEPAAPAPEPAAPVFDSSAAATTTAAAPAMEVDMVVDEVMYPGETLDDKARQYGVSKSDILRANGLSSESQIKEGQTIRIPIAE